MAERMDLLDSSECSSGCESGWTMYLEHSVSSSPRIGMSSSSERHHRKKRVEEQEVAESEEEEDLSMVSDASSGPPHLDEEACGCGSKPFSAASREARGQKQRKGRNRGMEEQKVASFLDDTASSPPINSNSNCGVIHNNLALSESAADFSQGFSATHFLGRASLQDEFGFFQSALSGKGCQNSQWF